MIYMEPEIEVFNIGVEDVIRTSGIYVDGGDPISKEDNGDWTDIGL